MASHNLRGAAVDAALADMFGSLKARGVPEHLRNVVDQLHAAALAEDAAAEALLEDATPSPSRSSSPEP